MAARRQGDGGSMPQRPRRASAGLHPPAARHRGGRAVTARLKQALALVEVRVLDHFIVGDGAPTSMARRGWV